MTIGDLALAGLAVQILYAAFALGAVVGALASAAAFFIPRWRRPRHRFAVVQHAILGQLLIAHAKGVRSKAEGGALFLSTNVSTWVTSLQAVLAVELRYDAPTFTPAAEPKQEQPDRASRRRAEREGRVVPMPVSDAKPGVEGPTEEPKEMAN